MTTWHHLADEIGFPDSGGGGGGGQNESILTRIHSI